MTTQALPEPSDTARERSAYEEFRTRCQQYLGFALYWHRTHGPESLDKARTLSFYRKYREVRANIRHTAHADPTRANLPA